MRSRRCSRSTIWQRTKPRRINKELRARLYFHDDRKMKAKGRLHHRAIVLIRRGYHDHLEYKCLRINTSRGDGGFTVLFFPSARQRR
jgi:hypothetical protein